MLAALAQRARRRARLRARREAKAQPNGCRIGRVLDYLPVLQKSRVFYQMNLTGLPTTYRKKAHVHHLFFRLPPTLFFLRCHIMQEQLFRVS